jgi:hypothetical protein
VDDRRKGRTSSFSAPGTMTAVDNLHRTVQRKTDRAAETATCVAHEFAACLRSCTVIWQILVTEQGFYICSISAFHLIDRNITEHMALRGNDDSLDR